MPGWVPVGTFVQVTSPVARFVIVQFPAGVAFPIPSLKSVGKVLPVGRVKLQVVVLFTVAVPSVLPTPHTRVRAGISEAVNGG